MKRGIVFCLLCAFLMAAGLLTVSGAPVHAVSETDGTVSPSPSPQASETPTPTPDPTIAPSASPSSKPSALDNAKKDFKKLLDENKFFINAKKVSSSKVKLSWKNGNRNFIYKVWSMTKKGGSYRSKKLLATTSSNSYTASKLNKQKRYKFYVQIYFKDSGNTSFLAQSVPLVLTTGSKNYLNIKTVTAKKRSTVLYKKQTHKIRCGVKLSGNRLCLRQPSLNYYSADASVAKVSAKGVITPLKKGKTVVFVIAPSGAYDKIYVQVKA